MGHICSCYVIKNELYFILFKEIAVDFCVSYCPERPTTRERLRGVQGCAGGSSSWRPSGNKQPTDTIQVS